MNEVVIKIPAIFNETEETKFPVDAIQVSSKKNPNFASISVNYRLNSYVVI